MPLVTASTPAIDASFETRIKVPLYEHQLRVLFLVSQFESNSSIELGERFQLQSTVGLLSCPPGSGKSITALSLALTARQSSSVWKPQSLLTSGSVMGRTLPWLNASMIVVPNVLVSQWTEYVERFADIQASKWVVVKTQTDSALVLSNPDHLELLIVSADRYNDFSGEVHFKRVIFDEVDTIHIPSCKKIDTDRIWCLSSNQERIRCAKMQNRGFLKDMFSEFKRIATRYNSSFWDIITIRTDVAYLQTTMCIPSCPLQSIRCKPLPPEVITIETRELSSLFNSGLEREVVNALGMGYSEGRVSAYLSLTASLQENMLELNNQAGTTPEDMDRHHCSLMKLYKEMEDIRGRVLGSTICPISYGEITHPSITGCCKNVFESAYLIPWVYSHNSCPLCRTSITTQQVLFCQTSQLVLLDKFEMLVKWVEPLLSISSNRVLICGRDKTLVRVKQYLEWKHFQFTSFRGRAVRRTLLQFEQGNPNILLLDVGQYSTGLNLTATTHLIIMDILEDHLHTQVVGRAQRIGRVTPLQLFQVDDVC